MKMKLFILVSVLVSVGCANGDSVEKLQQQEQIKEAAAVFRNVIKSAVEDTVSRALGDRDPINLPYFPMLSTETISLSMSEFEFGGFTDIEIVSSKEDISSDTPKLAVTWPAIRLNAEGYVAGGHIERVPFVGRSSMRTTIVEMNATLTYEREPASGLKQNYCVTKNTTQFELTMDHLSVRFNDLNPGQDTGEVINGMISSIGPDIANTVTKAFNTESGDNILVTLVNSAINLAIENKPAISIVLEKCDVDTDVEDVSDDLQDIFEDMIDNLDGFSEAFAQLKNLGHVKDAIEKLALRF